MPSLARCLPMIVLFAAALAATASCTPGDREEGRSGQEAAGEDLATGGAAESATATTREDTTPPPGGQEASEAGEDEAMAGSGVEGWIVMGPTCPRETRAEDCPERPYSAEITVRRADSGERVTAFNSGADGRFRVDLPPGRYILDPGEPALVYEPRAEPLEVVVEPGGYTEVTLRFDSGVR